MSPYVAGNRPVEPSFLTGSRKAIIAFIVAGIAPVGAVLASSQELNWRVAAAAVVSGLIAGGGVWLAPNATAQPPDAPVEDGGGQ
jgi:hypothetical protein